MLERVCKEIFWPECGVVCLQTAFNLIANVVCKQTALRRKAATRSYRHALRAGCRLGAVLLLLVLLVAGARPAGAQDTGATTAAAPRGFFAPMPERTIFLVGWQVGHYTQHGMGNMYYHALRLNRSPSVVSLQQRMTWSEDYGGPQVGFMWVQQRVMYEVRWSNRHTIRAARWTDSAGTGRTTRYRVRLNEVSIGAAYPLWGGRLRPGLSFDFGFFRVSRRNDRGASKDKWVPMHAGGSGLSSNALAPTAGITLYASVAPLGKRGGGLTVRPFYQWHMIEGQFSGLAESARDDRSFAYGLHNYGLALGWGVASK